MKHSTFNGIRDVTLRVEGSPRRAQEIECCHEGCTATLSIPVNDTRKPPDVIFNMARRKGWDINEGKRSFHCPEHRKEKKVTTKEPEVRQPSKEQRRLIFREIDENYTGRAYVSGVTDKVIGEKLKMPWAWVASVREENFGPAGLDPELQRAITTVDELEARVKQMETEALAAFESSVREIADVAQQLSAVRASLLKLSS